MSEQHPAIRLTGLTKEFGTVTAVDHVDLEIAAGEFFSMLGPSGSGKTTVLRLIAGFEQPDGRHDRALRAGRHQEGPVRPRRQHGVPGLRALPAHDGARERRLRPARAGRRPRRASRARHEGARGGAPRADGRAQARAALGRPAPARRPRPRDRRRSPRCSSSTSRSAPSTSSSASRCRSSSSRSSATSASRSSS